MAHLDPKAARAADRAHIGSIDAQIKDLEERIRLLRIERVEPQQRLTAYKYPVLTLPPEVVSDILIHTLPPYPVCPPLTGPASPIALAHICGTWREIALSTPQLWRSIWLRHTDHLQIPIEVVQPWLARSGSCPLSIQIESEQWGASMTPGPWEAIRPFIQRSEQAVITSTGDELRSLLKGRMPMLRRLSLTMKSQSPAWRPHVTPLYFPQLREVSLSRFSHPVEWLPWAQLTSLTLDAVTSHTYIPILQDAIHLVDLAFINCSYPHIQSHADIIPLPRLKALVIEASNAAGILDMINLPALKTLQLSCKHLGSIPILTLGPLISGFKLQKLFLTGERPWRVSKKAFRSAFPAISEIGFNSGFEWDSRQD